MDEINYSEEKKWLYKEEESGISMTMPESWDDKFNFPLDHRLYISWSSDKIRIFLRRD